MKSVMKKLKMLSVMAIAIALILSSFTLTAIAYPEYEEKEEHNLIINCVGYNASINTWLKGDIQPGTKIKAENLVVVVLTCEEGYEFGNEPTVESTNGKLPERLYISKGDRTYEVGFCMPDCDITISAVASIISTPDNRANISNVARRSFDRHRRIIGISRNDTRKDNMVSFRFKPVERRQHCLNSFRSIWKMPNSNALYRGGHHQR